MSHNLKLTGLGTLLTILMSAPAWADIKTGVAAYKRGDYTHAYNAFAELAQQGNPRAQYNLGILYLTGRGVPKDARTAVDWHRRAAEQGLANAQFNLGVMYYNGEGVRQNPAEVVKWVSFAAGQGFAHAQFRLGIMYEEGTILRKNSQEAIKWFQRAAGKGHEKAGTRAAALAAKMKVKALAEVAPPAPASKPPANKTAANTTLEPSATAEKEEIRPPDVEPAAGPAAAPDMAKPASPPPAPTTLARLAPPAADEFKIWRVQLASLRSLEVARKSWNTMKRAHADVLASMEPVIERIDLGPGKGIYHRLQAGPLKGRADAKAKCAAIKRRIPGQACILVPPNH